MTTQAQLEEAFSYVWSIAPSPYIHWYSGDVSYYDGPPAWGVNAEAPDASYVQPQGGFCVAVLNLMLRYLEIPIPNPFNDPANDGGTYSTYWAYYDRSKWFSNVRNDLPNYALLIAPFVNGVSEGHVAMVWYWNGVPYILEWIYSGLSYAFTSDYSNDNWGYYEIMVPPEVWAGLDATGGDTPLPEPAASDKALAAAIDPYLGGHGKVIVGAAKGNGLDLALACALVEQESNGQNIFGCDDEGPFCHEDVTPERIAYLRDGGNYSHGYQGVGLTQITWWTLVEAAEGLGGAHLPENQCSVGFGILKRALDTYSYLEALGAYNAGDGNRWAGIDNGYAGAVAAKHEAWKEYLSKVVEDPTEPPEPLPHKEEDMVVSKYTFVGHGQVATDIAGAAAYALEAVGVDTLFYNAPKSIEMAAAQVRETNDPGIANCIVIGKEVASTVAGYWSGDDPIWYADPTPEDPTLSALLFCRSWVLDWIAGHGENLPASVTNKLFKVFDGALKLVDEEYGVVLQKVIADNDHNPPPPPPEAERIEMQVEVKNFQDNDLVSVKRKEQK